MTQLVTNTLNNLEQMLSTTQKDMQKVSASVDSAMDKSTDFKKVFDSTINKESSTIAEVREKISTEDMSVTSADFKKILEKETDEANVETSLDLTLARDINEIISQLKEAVENATEIIEENSESLGETFDDDLTTVVENVESDSEEIVSSADEKDAQSEQKVPFEQVLTFVDKTLTTAELELKSLQLSEENSTTIKDMTETTQNEIIELAENLTDEVVSAKSTEETASNDIELLLDEEIVKDLKIESISAETDTFGGETLMQNQTPEEYAVKAMINQEIETFELKLDSAQTLQNSQQPQAKPVDVNPSRIIDQIAKQMDGLQNGGKVNIVLNPESLGKVNIQLLSTKEGLTAQFTVTTQEARDMLTKGLDGLKESLGAHGVAVDNVSVKVADAQKSDYKQDWTEQDGSRGGNKGQGQPNREEKEKGLFEKMMAQTQDIENGNV